MKTVTQIQCRIDNLKKKPLLIKYMVFCVSFIFLLCLGMSLARHNMTYYDLYFGADNGRAFGDLIVINDVIHWRLNVHPLLLILIQPVSLLLDGIIHDSATSLAVLGSFAGALNAVGIYDIIQRYSKNSLLKFGIIMVYVCCFSTMIFSSIPETFIFSSVYLVMYWNYVLCEINVHNDLSKRDYIILIFFGVACFGCTITNYFSYIIGLLFIIFFKCGNVTSKIKHLFLINIINGGVILSLSKIQQLAWKGGVKFFLKTIPIPFFSGFSLNSYSETTYMDFTVSLSKLKEFFMQTWVYPLVGGNPIETSGLFSVSFIFGGASIWAYIACILLLICVVYAVLNIIRHKKYSRELCALLLVWFYNLLLHFFYGSNEAFLYTPHYIFIPLIIIGIGLSLDKRRYSSFILIIVGVIEVLSNLLTYRKLTALVVKILMTPYYPVIPIFLKTTLIGLAFALIGLLVYRVLSKVVIFKVDTSYKQKILVAILFYILLIGVSTFWIFFNC